MSLMEPNLSVESYFQNLVPNTDQERLLKQRYPILYLRLQQLFELYLGCPIYTTVFEQLNFQTRPISILLYGPSGTGKTLFIKHFMRRFELQPIFLHLGPLQLKYPEHLGHALVHLFLNAKDRPIVLERVDLFARIPELFLCLQFLLRQYGGLIVCTSFEKPDSLPFQYTFQLAAPSLPPPNHSLHFKDVFGMEHVKLQLLKNRHTLLYGPPGTGKTMLATAFAAEYQGHFFPVRLSELISYFVGVTEKKLVELFKKAKDAGPSIIFLDELDTLCPTRESGTSSMGRKLVTQLSLELDAAPSTTRVIAATNRPHMIDPCLLRSGRMEVHIYVGPPTSQNRVIFLTRFLPLVPEDVIEKTEGYTSADLKALIRRASGYAEKRNHGKIEMEDLNDALDKIKPSISKTEIRGIENWSSFIEQK